MFRKSLIRLIVKIQIILISTALLTNCTLQSGTSAPPANLPLVGELKRVSPLFVMSYTSDFARRFKLPTQNAKPLSTGLDAIAIEFQPQAAQINCLVHLYLNDQVNVYAPNNNPDFSQKPQAEYFFVSDYNDSDYAYNVAEVDKSLTHIVYRSKSVAGGGKGWVDTLQIYRIKQHFLPNLSILSVELGCSSLNPKYAPAEIVVQKADTGEYKVGLEDLSHIKNADKIYAFDIPLSLHQYIKKYIDFAVTFNTQTTSSVGNDNILSSVEFR